MGNIELEKLLACMPEHLEFHVWYLKEKGYVQRTDQGFLTLFIERRHDQIHEP